MLETTVRISLEPLLVLINDFYEAEASNDTAALAKIDAKIKKVVQVLKEEDKE